MAPYWTDHDIRKRGEIYYDTLQKGRTKNGDIVLDEVNRYVRLNTEQQFTGTFMILAEWRGVHPYPHGSCNYYDIIKSYPSTRSFINKVYTYKFIYSIGLIILTKSLLKAMTR